MRFSSKRNTSSNNNFGFLEIKSGNDNTASDGDPNMRIAAIPCANGNATGNCSATTESIHSL
ncbi:MAG: hypothetical protein ACD_29C00267G0001 [uncultured bacterium]|nr:MAG: hypothetical protein ACD_29C00267G0001 [uncultured bacterium]